MLKCSVYVFAAALALSANYGCYAGPFSAIRERISGEPQQPPQVQPTPAAIPGPAEQGGATPKPTADPEKVKALQKEISWEKPPRDLFQRYAGKWVGNFWVYSPQGKKEQIQKVTIDYTPEADGSMTMRTFSFDMLSKAWVTQETARYSVDGDKVTVDIRRPSGETARQVGHFNDGSLFLEAQINDGAEHFRERIDGQRLLIDGYGIYGSLKGKDRHAFIGRFQKQQ